MKIDFHIHTTYSRDSIITPKKLAQICRKKKLIPTITDHNKYFTENLDVPFIRGEEIKTTNGDILAINTTDFIKPNLPCEETIDLIKELNGIAICAHPFDKTRKGCLSEKADGVELNARASPRENQKAQEFGKKHLLLITAGSDAHFPDEIGLGYVEGPEIDDLENTKQLISFIKQGGPQILRHIPIWERVAKKIIRKILRKQVTLPSWP